MKTFHWRQFNFRSGFNFGHIILERKYYKIKWSCQTFAFRNYQIVFSFISKNSRVVSLCIPVGHLVNASRVIKWSCWRITFSHSNMCTFGEIKIVATIFFETIRCPKRTTPRCLRIFQYHTVIFPFHQIVRRKYVVIFHVPLACNIFIMRSVNIEFTIAPSTNGWIGSKRMTDYRVLRHCSTDKKQCNYEKI